MRESWQLWEGIVPKETCDSYIKLCQSSCIMQDGVTFNNATENTRKTKIGWTQQSHLINLVKEYTNIANRAVFGLDVDFVPALQFGEYSEGCLYDWHHDIDWTADSMYDRKLSFVLQLTDPSEYEGGVLEFKSVQTPYQFSTQGSIIVFPSYLEHRVTEISKGIRHSLVCWAEGPRWR